MTSWAHKLGTPFSLVQKLAGSDETDGFEFWADLEACQSRSNTFGTHLKAFEAHRKYFSNSRVLSTK